MSGSVAHALAELANTVGTAGNSGDNNGPGEGAASAGAAIDELEAIKAAGAHVLAIGVGDASDDANFDLLTRTVEPNNAQVWEESDGGLPDLRVVDSIRVTSFGALENALRRVVFALCSPSVTITKVNDANAPVAGWDFTGEVDVTPTDGGTDQYQWLVPALGVTADNGSGNDGGAGSAAARTRTTNASGQALFQWAPNTVAEELRAYIAASRPWAVPASRIRVLFFKNVASLSSVPKPYRCKYQLV